MNLILTELLVSFIGIPVDALASGRGGWDLGKNLCIGIGFLLTFLGEQHLEHLFDLLGYLDSPHYQLYETV